MTLKSTTFRDRVFLPSKKGLKKGKLSESWGKANGKKAASLN